MAPGCVLDLGDAATLSMECSSSHGGFLHSPLLFLSPSLVPRPPAAAAAALRFCVALLLQGANPNLPNQDGWHALDLACDLNKLGKVVVKAQHVPVHALLVGFGAKNSGAFKAQVRTPLAGLAGLAGSRGPCSCNPLREKQRIGGQAVILTPRSCMAMLTCTAVPCCCAVSPRLVRSTATPLSCCACAPTAPTTSYATARALAACVPYPSRSWSTRWRPSGTTPQHSIARHTTAPQAAKTAPGVALWRLETVPGTRRVWWTPARRAVSQEYSELCGEQRVVARWS